MGDQAPRGSCERRNNLSAALGIPPVLANLLVQRGIETHEEAWQFFNPKLENLHDPFLMKDMDRAVRRVDEAVRRGEPVMVYERSRRGRHDGGSARLFVPATAGPPFAAVLHPRPLYRRVRRVDQGDRLCAAQGGQADHRARLRDQGDGKGGLCQVQGNRLYRLRSSSARRYHSRRGGRARSQAGRLRVSVQGTFRLRSGVQDVAGVLSVQGFAFLGGGVPA